MSSGNCSRAGVVVVGLAACLGACSSSKSNGQKTAKGPYEQPKVLASQLYQPTHLIHDDSSLFFLAGDGTPYDVYSLPDQGGTSKKLATTGVGALAENAGEIYLATSTEVDSMPASGGTPAHFADSTYNVVDIAVDASGVYWAQADSEGYGNIVVVAPDDTQPKDVTPSDYAPDHIALGNTAVYWVTGGTVFKAPKSGGAAQKLATAPASVSDGIAVDDSYVYWTALDNLGTVRRVSKSGGDAKILVQGLDTPRAVAVDAKYVYFTVEGAGLVERVPKGGGTVERLAVDQENPHALALGSGKVFWANFEGYTISSVGIL